MPSFLFVNQDLKSHADFLLVEFVTDLLLHLHQLVGTGLLFFLGQLVLHPEGMCILLMRVGENTQTFKFHAFHKVYHFLKLPFALSRMPGNQGGTDGNLWDQITNAMDQFLLLFSGSASAHGLEYIRRTVLEWNVQVLANIWTLLHDFNHIHRKTGRIGIVQANPVNPLHIRKLAKELG